MRDASHVVDDGADFPRQIARTQRFTRGVPEGFVIAPDRDEVLFLRSEGGVDPVRSLYLQQGATERRLVDPRALGASSAGGLTRFAADDHATRVSFTCGGRVWLAGADDGSCHELPTGGGVSEATIAPSGRHVAFLQGGSLRVADVDDGSVVATAVPDSATVTYGRREPTTMLGAQGFWWAPDSSAVVTMRVDSSPMPRVWFADATDPRRRPLEVRYPFVGAPYAHVSLQVVPVDGPTVNVGWDRARFVYVVSAGWDDHSPWVVVQTRDQRRQQLLAVDPASGDTVLVREDADAAWVERIPGIPARTEAGRIVHTADVGATRHLAIDGELVTPTGLQVRELLGVDGERVLFAASDEPTQQHVWIYDPALGASPLTTRAGIHRGWQRRGRRVILEHTEDGRSFTFAGHEATYSIRSCEAAPVVIPTPTWLSVGPRQIRTVVLFPSERRRGDKRLPVLLSPYGGPALQRVTRARSWQLCEAQWFADQGFAVIIADGSGTPGRGPQWEKEVHGDQLTPVLADQIAALTEVGARYDDVDLSRVAIRGASFGGTLAAAAVLRHPDVFHAAIAEHPVTDAALYNSHYRERYLGDPTVDPENYRRCSIINEAQSLTRPLLLIHGLDDTTVFAAHTLRFSGELFRAGAHHELVLLPSSAHVTADEVLHERLLRRQLDFLRKNLAEA